MFSPSKIRRNIPKKSDSQICELLKFRNPVESQSQSQLPNLCSVVLLKYLLYSPHKSGKWSNLTCTYVLDGLVDSIMKPPPSFFQLTTRGMYGIFMLEPREEQQKPCNVLPVWPAWTLEIGSSYYRIYVRYTYTICLLYLPILYMYCENIIWNFANSRWK